MRARIRGLMSVLVAGAVLVGASADADAFCGFYVSGADSQLYNNATQVVMMREGRRTVLSMRNNYQGPPQGFAMVVPVPVVLEKDNVKTLPVAVFDRIDKLTAPRLVEYWEQDPCAPPEPEYDMAMAVDESAVAMPTGASGARNGVTIEAQFDVGEYNVVILSANDSTGLETWLKQEKYAIPAGAGPHLQPYVEAGSKFFVAKVDPTKVTFKDGQAMLSPLRFHYDSKDFSLPVRLGLMNSSGKQDLLVYLLAQGQRYETANYPNVTIPTNINVKDAVRKSFGEFYAALFDSTLEKNPKAVVTEYSWDAGSCDPCPEPALSATELATLGSDVLGAKGASYSPRNFVVTRLHARYSAETLGEDLIFKAAAPIAGGREFSGTDGLERGSQPSGSNNFQGRYAIRHEWSGKVDCPSPRRGIWGGPPRASDGHEPMPATNLAFARRGALELASVVAQDIPEIGLVAGKVATAATANTAPSTAAKDDGKKNSSKGCTTTGRGAGLTWALAFAALLWRRRRSHVESEIG